MARPAPIESGDHRLEHERQLGSPSGRTDQTHDRGLRPPGVRGDLHHVRDQQQRRQCLDQRDDDRRVADPVQQAEQPVQERTLVGDRLHPRLAVELLGDHPVPLRVEQLHVEGGRERLGRADLQQFRLAGELLLVPLEGGGLALEVDALDVGVGLQLLVDVLARANAGSPGPTPI